MTTNSFTAYTYRSTSKASWVPWHIARWLSDSEIELLAKSRAREFLLSEGVFIPEERLDHLHEGEIAISMNLRGKLARDLLAEARKRKCEPVELLADVIEKVFADNLVMAIVDD